MAPHETNDDDGVTGGGGGRGATIGRRDFLRATAGVAAAGAGLGAFAMSTKEAQAMTARRTGMTTEAVGATGGAGAARPERYMKKSLKLGMIKLDGASLEEKFRLAKACGFDGVEMDSPNGFETDEVLAARDAAGIVIPGVVDSVHWGQPLSHPDPAVRAAGLAGLETALRDCHAYGGTTVLLVPAVVNREVRYDEAYERSQAEVKKALPLAEELGVTIAFENVWNHFLLSPMEAARYVDEFESDRVGWYFDVGNIVNYGWPAHWVRVLGDRLVKLDIKDFSRGKRDAEGLWKGFGVEIGDGDADWPEVMAALDEIGYTTDAQHPGWGSAEVSGGGRERLTEIAERMGMVYGA